MMRRFKETLHFLRPIKRMILKVLIMDDKEIDEIVTPFNWDHFKEWSLKDITTIDAQESKSKG